MSAGSAAADLRDTGVVTHVGAAAVAVAAGLLVADVVDARAALVTAALTAIGALFVVLSVEAATFGRDRRLRSRADVALLLAGVTAVPLVVATLTSAPPTVPGVASPGGGVFAAALDGLWRGWSALVTSPTPATSSSRLLVPVAVAVWVQVVATGLIGRRTSTGAAVLLPSVALVVGAAVVGGAEQVAPGLVAAIVVTACAAVLVGRSESGPSRPSGDGVRPWIGPVGAVVAVATVATIGGALVLGDRADRPFDARDRLVPPVVPQDATNPLDLVPARRASPDQPMFTMTVVGGPADLDALTTAPTRLLTLDDYDGARWTVSAPFERTGARLPTVERTDVMRRPVTVDVTIDALTGPWLPSLGDPSRLRGLDALVEPSSGSLIEATDGDVAVPVDEVRTYRLETELVVPDLTALQYSQATTPDARFTVVPTGLPDPLQEMAGVATAGATSPLAQAVLLERYLRLSFVVDDELVSGSSYRQLAEALTERGTGTPEQFATAYAVLGRVVGLPTRVVVGFGPATAVDDSTALVRSGDARVWPEVHFDGAGWVAFDPVPPRADDLGGNVSSVGTSGQEVVVQAIDDTIESATAGGGGDAEASSGASAWARRIAVAVASLAGLVVLAALVVVLAKRRLTARRRAGTDPTARVLGAWHDVLDRRRELGDTPPSTMTVEQIVEADPDAAAALTGLYRPVTRALYAPGRSADPDADAEQAWRARDRYVRHIRQHGSTTARLRRSLDVRCLVHRWDTDRQHPTATAPRTRGTQR